MDYSATIETTASVAKAAHAIQHEMDIWWSTRVELSDHQATIRFHTSHVTFVFDPDGTDNQFAWTCTDAHMVIEDVGDAGEWKGTKLLWEIEPTATGKTTGKTTGSRVTLTHQGLNPDLECHRVCVAGWGRYFENSLKNHLNGDAAMPENS